MFSIFRPLLAVTLLLPIMIFTAREATADTYQVSQVLVEYSRNPQKVLISFREVIPEIADQDPTPLVRIYGDGRVVIFHPRYMKQAGQYEMMLPLDELEDMLRQFTPVLMNFDADNVKREKKAANDLLRVSATGPEDLIVFHDSDAEFSIFHMNIDAYMPDGLQGPTITNPDLDRSWRGLRFDARDYPGLESIQALMQMETKLRDLTKRDELVLVEALP